MKTELRVILATALCAIGLSAVAEPVYVARVNVQSYETIDEALAAADAGDTVTLLKDVALADTLVIDKAITLNLDDKTLSLPPTAAVGIDVKAATTVSNGVVVSTREAYGTAYAILNEAVNATYKDLEIDAKNYKFGLTCDSPALTDTDIWNECEAAPTVTVACENVDITGNGTMFYAQHTILNLDADCSATAAGEPQGYAAAVYSALNAAVTIAGGNYTNKYSLISGNLGGKIVVNGGTFKGDIKSYMKVDAHSELEALEGYKAVFELNGGTYDGKIVFDDADFASRVLDSITKGDDVVLAAPEGMAWDGTGLLCVAEAKIGEKLYATLTNAVASASEGQTVTLLMDVALADTLVIDKAITLDLNDETLSLPPTAAVGIDVKAAATVSNGVVRSTRETYGTAYAILNEAVNATYKDLEIDAKNYKFGLTCDSPGELVAECTDGPTVTVSCRNVDITGNGTMFYAQYTILSLDEDCSATAEGEPQGYAAAVYSALNAAVTIAGGNYTNKYSLISGNLGGKIVVNGGTFKGDIKSYMKVDAHSELEALEGYKAVFELNGGTYDGKIVFDDADFASRVLDSITKGDDVVLAAPEGMAWDGTGLLCVAEAKIGDMLYATLTNAVASASEGDTVTLLKNVALADTLAITKAITFNLDGKTLSLPPTAAVGIDVKAATTVSNGVVRSTRETYGTAYAILNEAVNATYKDLEINAKNYKFGLTCDSPALTDVQIKSECETPPTVTVTCENVDITGNGTMFYAQHTILSLDADCSATGTDDPSTGTNYRAAVYSALNAAVTIAGGGYTNVYSLISGNLGGKITVTDGEFKGDIKSYMKVGAHSELVPLPGYKAVFELNGGTYDGEIEFEDADFASRALDYFKKNLAVVTTLAAPEGYAWNESGELKTVYYVSYNKGEDDLGLPPPGGEAMNLDTFVTDSPTNLTACGYTRDDFVFAGWKGWTNGVEVSHGDQAAGVNFTQPGETLALTAQWTRVAVPLTVTNLAHSTVTVWTNGVELTTDDVNVQTNEFGDGKSVYLAQTNANVTVVYRAVAGYMFDSSGTNGTVVLKNLIYGENDFVPDVALPTVVAIAEKLAEGTNYKVDGDAVVITSFPETADGVLIIPATIGGKSVKAIADKAFQYATWLRELVIDEGLAEIGSAAFDSCSGLERVVIPASVTNVGPVAFMRCFALKTLEFKGNAPAMQKLAKLDYGICWGAHGFTVVTASGTTGWDEALKKLCEGWQTFSDPVGGVYTCTFEPRAVVTRITGVERLTKKDATLTINNVKKGLTYTLQGAETLGGEWKTLKTAVGGDADTLVFAIPADTGTSAFFRVTVSDGSGK